jgi:hypothetical protein
MKKVNLDQKILKICQRIATGKMMPEEGQKEILQSIHLPVDFFLKLKGESLSIVTIFAMTLNDIRDQEIITPTQRSQIERFMLDRLGVGPKK